MGRLASGRRILVVEDDMLVRLSIESMLADLGCTSVSVAATVKQALSLLDSQAFDLAMLDLNLDGSRSDPVADALAARGVPFLFSTGYSEHQAYVAYPGRPVLMKPYPSSKLVAALTELLNKGASPP